MLAGIVKLATIFTGCKAHGASFNPQNNWRARGSANVPPECPPDGPEQTKCGSQSCRGGDPRASGWMQKAPPRAISPSRAERNEAELKRKEMQELTGHPFLSFGSSHPSPLAQVFLPQEDFRHPLPSGKLFFFFSALTELCRDAYYTSCPVSCCQLRTVSPLKERPVSHSSCVHSKLNVCLKKVEPRGRTWTIGSGLGELRRQVVYLSLTEGRGHQGVVSEVGNSKNACSQAWPQTYWIRKFVLVGLLQRNRINRMLSEREEIYYKKLAHTTAEADKVPRSAGWVSRLEPWWWASHPEARRLGTQEELMLWVEHQGGETKAMFQFHDKSGEEGSQKPVF